MDGFEIMMIIAGAAAGIAAAAYEWRSNRRQMIEELEKRHELQRVIDALTNDVDSLSGRLDSLESTLSTLIKLSPIASRGPNK